MILGLSVAFFNILVLFFILMIIGGILFYGIKNDDPPNIGLISVSIMIVTIIAIVFFIFYNTFFPKCNI